MQIITAESDQKEKSLVMEKKPCISSFICLLITYQKIENLKEGYKNTTRNHFTSYIVLVIFDMNLF